MLSSVFLELQNAAFFWVSCYASFIFLRYIYVNFGMGYKFLEGAIALLAVWLSSVLIRGPLWWTRYQVNSGIPQEVPELSITAGSILGILAFICVVRIFSEQGLRTLHTVLSVIGLIIFVGLSYYKLIPIL